MTIHSEDPFAVPPDQRDPIRRFRGRLAAPVTVLTAAGERPAGLTVSSVFVVEGEPARVAALVGSGADFIDAAEAAGTFLVHILTVGCQKIADVFAGLRPSPGGMFASVEVEHTAWGPKLAEVRDWAGCRLETIDDLGDQRLVIGVIEELEVSEMEDPLIYFRGAYRRLGR